MTSSSHFSARRTSFQSGKTERRAEEHGTEQMRRSVVVSGKRASGKYHLLHAARNRANSEGKCVFGARLEIREGYCFDNCRKELLYIDFLGWCV